MAHPAPTTPSFFTAACVFESALLGVAIVLAWLLAIDLAASFSPSESAFAEGIALTVPPLALFWLMRQLPYAPLQQIQQLLANTLGASLQHKQWQDLLILAVIAGVSEEALFRGVLQPWLEAISSPNTGLLISSVVFGLVHAITPLYALLAMLMSLYLGMCLHWHDSANLLQPMVVHSLYDFVAFIVILRAYRRASA
jgi:membrane protease YdiL (CAAX protease family)